MSASNFNEQTINEFRKNHGKVGGYFEGSPLLLLHTKGKRSGKTHVVPIMYLKDGDRYLVFGSKAGADTHPDWFHNLKTHPDVTVEIGDETVPMHAEEIKGHERDALYRRQATLYPGFAEYERKTKRVIPVIALTRK
ncbi:MAG: nitroreductase family deazaflavin-dependent oxidoreductase [Nitrososphaerota archaeon]|jgi:deazaflavin-dependent oxidoreductase (nitroreductase family)|nr:nitroreductase family deazaflavin-dependent oxidoreductase [Nitrososphaerota archaeon]